MKLTEPATETQQNSIKGDLVRIERSSIHDGQGLRTVVFLKGCPLSCPWCSTPESQQDQPQKGYDALICLACHRCIEVCPVGAITPASDGLAVITDPEKCTSCFRCLTVCPSGAIKKYGFSATVAEVMSEISKDEIFYFHSGGGLTISGGEPLNQPQFCAALLAECKKLGINTALESSLYANYHTLEKQLPWLDHLYADLKHLDEQMHTLWVGQSNQIILENLTVADRSEHPFKLVIRIPLIPGFNDTHRNLQETVEFCNSLTKINAIELLPYHRLGSDTYRLLGLDYRCKDIIPPTSDRLQEIAHFIKEIASGYNVITAATVSGE